jgi:hypothetical protein
LLVELLLPVPFFLVVETFFLLPVAGSVIHLKEWVCGGANSEAEGAVAATAVEDDSIESSPAPASLLPPELLAEALHTVKCLPSEAFHGTSCSGESVLL